MNNLPTKDFKLNANGEYTISQRKLAAELGVAGGTLFRHIQLKHPDYNTISGLDAFLVENVCTYYAKKGKPKAIEFVCKLVQAGAKAYLIYNYCQQENLQVPSIAKALPAPEGYISKAEHDAIVSKARVEAMRHQIVHRHEELMAMVDKGILTHTQYIRTFWKYKLTKHGKDLGYTQNKNGTVFCPVVD